MTSSLVRSSIFAFILGLPWGVWAAGYSVKSSSELSSAYAAQHFETAGDGSTSDSFHFAGWDFSAGGARTKNQSSAGEETISNSRDASGAVDFGYAKEWTFTLSGDTNHATETEYTQNSAGLGFSYRHALDENRSFNFGLGTYRGNIKQHLSFVILNTHIERDVTLDQKETQISVGFAPAKSLSLRLQASLFTYNKSKQDLQTAFQNRFLNNNASDLITSIAGLPESVFKLSGTYQLNSDIDLNLSTSQTKHIVDDSTSRRSELTGAYYWQSWLLGGGIGRQQTEATTELTALVNIGYSWD